MNHKEKCRELKKVRKSMADQLGIDLQQRECTYQGECSGTCPKCRKEEETLNRALLAKGAVAAMAVATALTVTGCGPETLVGDVPNPSQEDTPDIDVESYEGGETYEPGSEPNTNLPDGEDPDRPSNGNEVELDGEVIELEGDVVCPDTEVIEEGYIDPDALAPTLSDVIHT